MIAAISILAITLSLGACAPGSTAVQLPVKASFEQQTGVAPSFSRSLPARIRIPAIRVNAALMKLGLNSNRTLQVPPNAYTAGWFTGAPAPGQIGPAVIAAHVHWNGQDGVFAHLSSLALGDTIVVTRVDGSTAVFRITQIATYKKSRFPTKLVYGNIGFAGLRLITCDGFDSRRRAYLTNLVVFAALIE